MSEKDLHPLINKKGAPHWDSEEEPAIQRFERIFTVSKLMGWAEITKAKYDDPARKNKNEEEADVIKSATYSNYYHMLQGLILKSPSILEMSAAKAYEALGISWRYR